MPKPKDVSTALKAYDDALRGEFPLICGMDEAGRGPLAGPVVCAGVVFPPDVIIPYVNDSKKLSEKRREELFLQISKRALCVSVGIADNNLIDEINILNATKKAMRDVVKGLTLSPDILLIDALTIEGVDIYQRGIIKGDATSFSIAAASIIAKVTRDRMMAEYDREYPGYGFSSHKGYGTAAHYAALRELGPCPIHRSTFLKTMH